MTGGKELRINVVVYCRSCIDHAVPKERAEMQVIADVEGGTAEFRCPECDALVDVVCTTSN